MKNTSFKLNSTPQKSKKPILIAIALVLLLVGAGIGYVLVQRSNQQKESSTSSDETSSQNKADPTDDTTEPKDVSTSTSEQIPVSETVSVSITNAAQQDATVNATAAVKGASTNGTCVFLFTSPDSRPVTRQVDNVTTSCSTSVPAVEFDKIGDWNLKVTYYNNNSRTEAQKNVTVN